MNRRQLDREWHLLVRVAEHHLPPRARVEFYANLVAWVVLLRRQVVNSQRPVVNRPADRRPRTRGPR